MSFAGSAHRKVRKSGTSSGGSGTAYKDAEHPCNTTHEPTRDRFGLAATWGGVGEIKAETKGDAYPGPRKPNRNGQPLLWNLRRAPETMDGTRVNWPAILRSRSQSLQVLEDRPHRS